ncbi:quinolinate synthase NadA [Candidatus Woesearchaeota archaeon]|nr:quinolinate synthase NadA [Candidatus Woesearchaeota archaeon]
MITEEQKELIEKINKLKKEKDAVILVHNYQRPEIYEVADHIGDSLGLSQEASKTKAKIIVFCGVDFMAETAKILNPDKKVLLPTKSAQCPMAAMVTVKELKELKEKYPDAAVISYVNTSAETKAESDICCTSRNFVEITDSLPNKEVIFVPDEHMGNYLQTKTDKKIIIWKGYCYVHTKISAENIKKAKQLHPAAEFIAHPECPMEILEIADKVCSTEGMIKYAKQSKAKEFIIATEEGMLNRLKKEVLGKKFYAAGGVCFNQKSINLENLYEALKKEQFEIKIPEEIRIKAKKAVERMMDVG